MPETLGTGDNGEGSGAGSGDQSPTGLSWLGKAAQAALIDFFLHQRDNKHTTAKAVTAWHFYSCANKPKGYLRAQRLEVINVNRCRVFVRMITPA